MSSSVAYVQVVPTQGLLLRTSKTDPDQTTNLTETELLIAPAPVNAGEYVCRLTGVDVGTLIVGPSGWVDVADAPVWYLTNDNPGTRILSTATFSVAVDAGGGTPDAGTQVDKDILYWSELVAGTQSPADILIPSTQLDLEDIQTNEDAYTSFRIGADGFLYGKEANSTVYSKIYSQTPGQTQFTVDQVSGSPLPNTNKLLTPTQDYTYEYTATEDAPKKQGVFDVQFIGQINTVTKRITMYAERINEGRTSIVMSEGPWGWTDIGTNLAVITLECRNDGTLRFYGLNNGSSPFFPQDWNSDAPAPPDVNTFECYLEPSPTYIGGSGALPPDATGSSPVNQWLNLGTTRTWTITIGDQQGEIGAQCEWLLTVRRTGQPSTEVTTTIRSTLTVGEVDTLPPGGIEP